MLLFNFIASYVLTMICDEYIFPTWNQSNPSIKRMMNHSVVMAFSTLFISFVYAGLQIPALLAVLFVICVGINLLLEQIQKSASVTKNVFTVRNQMFLLKMLAVLATVAVSELYLGI